MKREDTVLKEVLEELSLPERIIVKTFRKTFKKAIYKTRTIIANNFLR